MMRNEREREEAGQWFAVVRRGAITLEERQAFDLWRAEAGNQRALDGMHELWGELAVLKSVQVPLHRPRIHRRAFMAAAVGILMVGGSVLMLPDLAETRVTTGIGEQSTRALPDGSVMAVNVDSRVNYTFNERRRIRMDEGEAAFFVRKDPNKPFIVTAGAYDVRAVGTAFNVRRRGGATEVAVSEGVVAIISRDDGRELMRLRAGEMSILPRTPVKTRLVVATVPIATIAQWRMRVIEYDDVPVRALIAELNRFYDRPLHVDDAGLAGRRITIRLRVEDRDRTLQTVAGLLDAKIVPGSGFDTLRTVRAPEG